MKRITTMLMLALSALPAFGHEDGAHFSGAIIDPLEVHHAHIEDEQRLNFGAVRGIESSGGNGFAGSAEIAVAWDENFRWGTEVLLPFTDIADDRRLELGDVELWALKYAAVNDAETVITGVLGFVLPTGDESKGYGSGETYFAPHLLVDKAFGNVFAGLNLATEINVDDAGDAEVEAGTVLAYSFIRDTAGMAPTRPSQRFVPSLSVELLAERSLAVGEDPVLSVIPGLNVWHTASGWTVRTGVKLPASSEKENDAVYLFQIGNHLNWGSIRRGLRGG